MANSITYDQNTAAPTSKVRAGIIAGKTVAVLFGLLAIFYPEAFERIPAGFELTVGSLITSVITDIAAYMKKETA